MIIKTVLKTIQKHDMICAREHILVAVSGGADSVSLLKILSELREKLQITVTAVHLDHMLRGKESADEAGFVKNIAAKMGVPCVAGARDVAAFSKANKQSLQDAARNVRYEFLQDVMQQVHADKIALGHHSDDQAETVLMRLLRGSSLDGLAGIPPVRSAVFIRPLIETTRKEIETFLKENEIFYLPDTSRQEIHYLRNRIRHHLLPIIREEYNPQIIKTLTQLSDICRDDREVLDSYTHNLAGQIIENHGENITCSVEDLKKLPRELLDRVIRCIISDLKGSKQGLSYCHVESIRGLLGPGGQYRTVPLPGGGRVCRQYNELKFFKKPELRESYCYSFDSLPDKVMIKETGAEIFFQTGTNLFSEARQCLDPRTGFFDYEKIKLPVIIRNWLPGDRFRPLGLGGSKKLKDLFSDCKIPVEERRRIPVLIFRDTIVWVCGLRIDDGFKLTPGSGRALKVWIK